MSDDDPEFFSFREGKSWICAWRRFDVVSQGPTEKEAYSRMLRTIAAYAVDMAHDGTLTTFGVLKKPDDLLLARWRRSHRATHGN